MFMHSEAMRGFDQARAMSFPDAVKALCEVVPREVLVFSSAMTGKRIDDQGYWRCLIPSGEWVCDATKWGIVDSYAHTIELRPALQQALRNGATREQIAALIG